MKFSNLARAAILAILPVAGHAQFMSAAEIKPIMEATKGNWVALSDNGDSDLLYFTHLLSFRCGMNQVFYGFNGENPTTEYHMEPCYEGSNTPNAINPDVQLPLLVLPHNSVQMISVVVVFDDGSEDRIDVFRNEIMLP